jgi:hypothetical protein
MVPSVLILSSKKRIATPIPSNSLIKAIQFFQDHVDQDRVVFFDFDPQQMKPVQILMTTGMLVDKDTAGFDQGLSATTASERMASAGHRSTDMMKVYDVLPDVVKPTKN